MEFAEGGDVQQLITAQTSRRVYFAERDIWVYAWQLCLGILHIHSRGIIHRDIKCLNILQVNGKLKLGDMSESRVLDPHRYINTKKIVGTPLSLSPEVVNRQGYDQRSDIWGLGVALYTMACLQPPFQEDSMPVLMHSICYKQPKPITHFSQSFNDFVTKMLQKKKEDRPLITDLIESFADYPCHKIAILTPLDQENYWSYKKRA